MPGSLSLIATRKQLCMMIRQSIAACRSLISTPCYGIARKLLCFVLFVVALVVVIRQNFPHRSISGVTVVTAYYDIPSKHSTDEYYNWMTNFLRHIDCHLYIFTEEKLLVNLTRLRLPFLDRTKFIIQEFRHLDMYAKLDTFQRLKHTFPEKNVTAELMTIWHQKWKFISRAVQDNAFRSEYFIWCDVGSFRNPRWLPHLKHFPNETTVRSRIQKTEEVHLLIPESFKQRRPFTNDQQLDADEVLRKEISELHIGGTLAAGHHDAWKKWEEIYYPMLDVLLSKGINAGQDQVVMNAIALRHRDMVQLVQPKEYFFGLGNPWFYFQYYFS